MRVLTRKGPTGITGWLLVIIVGFFVWQSRDMIGGFAAQFLPAPKNSLRGEWVGTVDLVSPGEDTPSGEQAPASHRKAAIFLTLTLEDGFLKKYAGTGQMSMEGEVSPLSLQISNLSVDPDGIFRGSMQGDAGNGKVPPEYGDLMTGFYNIVFSFQPNVLTFSRNTSTHTQLYGTLHKGDRTAYEALCKTLQRE